MRIKLISIAMFFCAVLNSTAAPPTIVTSPPASNPAEKDGLTVVVQPLKDTFQSGEPLAIKLTFQNTSKEAFRLPDQVNPAKYGRWHLQLTNVDTGKTYTGVTILNGGAAPEPGEIIPVTVAPGQTLTTTATLQRYGYVEGMLDLEAAKNVLFQRGMAARRRGERYPDTGPQPPAGVYKVSVNVGFATYITYPYPNVPERIRIAQAQIEADSIPLWKGKTILSNPVEIKIVAPTEADTAPAAASGQP